MTNLTPSKKFIATIQHLSPARQAKAIAAWEKAVNTARAAEIDIAALNAGFDTGSTRADIWRAAGRLA